MASSSSNFAKTINERLKGGARSTVEGSDYLDKTSTKKATANNSKMIQGSQAKVIKEKKPKGSSRTSERAKSKRVADNPVQLEFLRKVLNGGDLQIKHKIEDPGFLEKHVFSPVRDFATPLSYKGLGRVVDLIGRVPAVPLEAGRRYVEASADEGNPFTGLGDAAKGAWHGAGGYQKTGWADFNKQLLEDADHIPNPSVFPVRDYVQDFLDKDRRLTPIIQNTSDIEEGRAPRDPEALDLTPLEQEKVDSDLKTFQLLGAAMDFTLDPTNLIGTPAIKAFRKGAEAVDAAGDTKRGIEAYRVASKEGVLSAVDDVAATISDFEKNKVVQKAIESSDKRNLAIEGGVQKGRTVPAARLNNQTIASDAALQYREGLLAPFERSANRLFKAIEDGKDTTKLRKNMRKTNPLFAKFDDELIAEAKKTMGAKGTVEKLTENVIQQAYLKTRQSVDSEVTAFRSAFTKQLADRISHRSGIMLGDRVIPIGSKRMYAKSRSWLDKIGNSSTGRLLSYERNLPGRAAEIGSGSRTYGIKFYDQIRKDFFDKMPKLTRTQEKIVQEALATGKPLAGVEGEAASVLREMYDSVGELLVKAGLRDEAEMGLPNYAFQYFKGESGAVGNVKAARKKLMQNKDKAGNIQGNPNWYADLQKTDAWKNVELMSPYASQNFQYYVADAMRKLIKADATEKMIYTFGRKAVDLSDEMVGTMGLKKVKPNWLTADLIADLKATPVGKKGTADWYIDEVTEEVMNYFFKLTTNQFSPESRDLLRNFDKMQSWLKKGNTVYFPAFHTRNAIGDFILGSMDGVQASDWIEIAAHEFPGVKKRLPFVRIDGTQIPYSEFKAAYLESAGSSGFFASDLPLAQSSRLQPGEVATAIKQKAISADNVLRQASEGREDWGRLAHFYHAMQEELPAARKTYKTEAEAWNNAIRSSSWRVNRYHADYGATTTFERNAMKRAFPFYTYPRRMLPVMLEAAFFNPKYFTVNNKMEQLNEQILLPESERTPPWYSHPQWMTDMGWANTFGGENPWGVAVSALNPVNLINQYMGGDSSETIKNVYNQATPMLKAGTDVAYEKNLFTGQDSERNFLGVMRDSLRPYTTFQSSQNGNVSNTEKLLRTGLGLPVYQLNEQRQESARKENEYEMWSGVEQINDQVEPLGYTIKLVNTKDGQVIKVAKRKRNGDLDEYLYEGTDLQRAIRELEKVLA